MSSCLHINFVPGLSQEFVPNGTTLNEKKDTKPDGEPLSIAKRSAEETEAAHDLLSLSQSLPPLPAPSVVMIHHTVPTEVDSSSPTHCYRPLTPELAMRQKKQEASEKRQVSVIQHAPVCQTTQPVIVPQQVVLPCYTTSPIVYVVQVPAAVPTPPTSECSSDVENVQLCTVERLHHDVTMHETNDDIIILPLSPEPDNIELVSVQQRLQNSSVNSPLNIPDRRKRRNKRNKSNRNSINHEGDENSMDFDKEQLIQSSNTVRISQINLKIELFKWVTI